MKMSTKDNNTFKEISSQISSWNSIYNDIVENSSVNIEILKKDILQDYSFQRRG
jgi:hypothetical protein